jgi:hypothetical protein
VPPMTEVRKTDDALAAYPLDLAQHAFAFVQRLPRLRTRTGWVCLTASPDVSSGTRDLRGCVREPCCARDVGGAAHCRLEPWNLVGAR